jgi:predicted enzyme related to lactoylglutathione lyase
MVTRERAPIGAPCWVDLWTSDVEGSRRFYSELFGWEAQEPAADFGGYWTFTLNGVEIAGGMGDMGPDMQADNTWKPYLSVDDINKTAEGIAAAGGQVVAPPMAVADLGTQTVLIDPTGAALGAWEPNTFPGFKLLNEHGAPSWFELHTRDYAKALDFYHSVFRWETDVVGDADEFRYSTVRNPDGEGELAGIMDASTFLPEGESSRWYVYWEVDDIDATVAKVKALGGAVTNEPEDTPYGRIASVADPTFAEFKLRTGPR